MKKSRYAEEQIVWILKESEAGMGTAELCRKHGISEQTFYRDAEDNKSALKKNGR